MVDLFFVKSFICVAQTGSFRLAAQRNNITQPAVSQHIRILEKNLNCSLFERSSKKTVLTPAGKIFLAYAQRMLDSFQEAKNEIEKVNNLSIGSIRIASIYSIGLYQLKSVIQHVLKQYPKINIHLEYCSPNNIYQMIQDKAVDFALVAFPKEIKGFTSKVFAFDQLVLVQSPKYRIIKSKKSTLEKLNNINFIGFDLSTPTGAAISQFFKNHKIKTNVVKEYTNIETIKNAVEVGMGCSILPKTTILQELENKSLEIIPVQKFDLKRPLALVYSDTKIFTKAARIFIDSISK
ncbi:MAG: LysR family transcriptional regulator [Candidatus Omnitrophica bacterium]|nr:LysR family transcriptional regulator [Candidatus Omnitrophota bacterium]